MTAEPRDLLSPAEPGAVLDALVQAVIVRDLDGVVLAWNLGAERVFGWSASEVVGRSIAGLVVSAADQEEARGILDHVEAGENWFGEFAVRRSDGGAARVLAHVAPLQGHDGTVVGTVCSADDVTDLLLLEKRSQDLADHLLLALSAGELGTWRWDMATGLTTWDEQMATISGVTLESFDGTYEAWISTVHPDDVAHTVAAVERAVAEISDYEFEHRVVWPDKSVHWVHCRGTVTVALGGSPTGTIGCAGDITSRKLAELDIERRVTEAESSALTERLQRERAEFLATLNDLVVSSADPQTLMRAVTAAAVPRLGDWCTIHFIGEPGTLPISEIAHVDSSKVEWVHDLQQRYPYDPNAASGVASVIRSGIPEFVHVDGEFIDAALSESPVPIDEGRAIADQLQLTSMITVPLTTQRGRVGAVQFVSAESGRRYDDDDFELAEAMATRLGVALDNAWLAQQHRQIATALQAELLPMTMPEIDGATLAVRYWAAGTVNEVGGDFYDVFPTRPNCWAIVIGDVCGTGPRAAAVTAKARHTVRAAATHGMAHPDVLQWINEAILTGQRGRFCTLLYATLEHHDDNTWTLTSVSGGHPLPIRITNGEAERLGEPGTLIGVLPQLELVVATTTMVAGDTLVMHTDGITDVPPPHGIDDDEMLALIGRSGAVDGTAEDVAEQLLSEISAVLPIPERSDDIALIVLRLTS